MDARERQPLKDAPERSRSRAQLAEQRSLSELALDLVLGPIPTADPLPTPPLPLQAAAPAAALTETNSTLDSHTDANTASDTTTLDA